jgi:hypothetical protein
MGTPMIDSHNLRLRIAWRQPAVASLACLVLAVGLVAPHDMAEERTGSFARVEIAESAVHPSAPAHFEDGEFRVHPPCPACLLQIQTGNALVRLPAALSQLTEDCEVAALVERIPSKTIAHPSPARAPPFLLSPSA